MITSFLGDGAMILFGLPSAMPDDAARALKCAIDLHRGVERWMASLPPAISGRLGFKIGAHFGPIVASRLGESHQHITANGDTVNLASRLMEVAAQNDARFALTDALLDAADFHGAPDGVLSGPLLTQIRGRSGVVTVWFWRDQDRPSQAADKAEMID
jgi:adenylate cyclase